MSDDLARVEALAGSIAATPWFTRVGQTLTRDDEESLADAVAGLGLEPGPIAPVATWKDAARVAADPGWDRLWWSAEAHEQTRLRAQAEERHGVDAALKALSRVADAALDPPYAAAEAAGDEALSRVAAGAAAQACHLAALALAAGQFHHGFLAKHRLFAAGRWPLGRIAERWYLF